jgi:transcriptional antiterminator NusG
MPDEAKWYVVHTYSGYENKVAATIEKTVENLKLQDLILGVNVPMETVIEIGKDNKRRGIERKVFPGYVLVKMVLNDESWHVVRNTRGVTSFVGPGSKPIPLTEAEVEALGMEKREIIVSYSVGDNVRITDGPLEGFVGIVDDLDISKNRVRVVVSMFGRETPVELELDQAESIVD